MHTQPFILAISSRNPIERTPSCSSPYIHMDYLAAFIARRSANSLLTPLQTPAEPSNLTGLSLAIPIIQCSTPLLYKIHKNVPLLFPLVRVVLVIISITVSIICPKPPQRPQ